MKRRVKVKVRALIVFIVTIILFGYVSYNVIYYGMAKKNYENEQNELQVQLRELKDKETDLNDEITKLKDEDYLARYAREEYLYSKDGEYIIKIEDNNGSIKNVSVVTQRLTIYLIAFLILAVITVGITIFHKINIKKQLKKLS